MQHVKDFGNSLIEPDIKRLKRLKSLQEDLGTYFTAHINQLETFGRLSCQITADKEYVVCKERIAITKPRLSPSSGLLLLETQVTISDVCFTLLPRRKPIRNLFVSNL